MIQNRICKQCNIIFAGGPRAYYCPDCRLERTKATNRDYKTRKKNGNVREIGSIDICKRCGEKYTVNGGLQEYCLKCKKEHALEHDRSTGLKFYHLHKEQINPIRNLRRQIGPVKCWWCGKKFITHNRKLTCSTECSNKRKNHLWNIWRNSGGKLKKYKGVVENEIK